jgi:hypothetical protein
MSVEAPRLRARIGGLALAAQRDPLVYTAAARQAFRDGFLEQVDPGLPESERIRRAAALRKLHYVRMALKSAKVRARNKTTDAKPCTSVEREVAGESSTDVLESV